MANSPQTRLINLLPACTVHTCQSSDWKSASFSGQRFNLTLTPEDPNEFSQKMATFDMDVTISGWIICDVEITHTQPVQLDILLVEG